jgi:diguanylate cyclase (GGDEF)-like protein
LGDIAKRERLDYLAHYSVPTGLANRTLFERRLGDEIAAARSSDTGCSALVVDVDRFRLLNDTLGRDAGDHLLGMIAQRLTSAFGDASRVAHLGADSFAIISPGCDAQARSTQAAVLAALARPFMLGTHEQWISVKTAQAMFPADADDAGMLLANAEAALKRARSRGDRHADYRAELNPRVSGNLDLENRLRRAIETRQFVLHYQPKVDLANGRIAGLEALIRWNDPQRGLVPPARFIPLLEETGLIIEVGGWVLEQAAADHRRWHALGLAPPRVAVNVSPLQLSQKGFVADVDRAARVAALDIEITEGVFLDDMARSTQTLHAIREIGVKVAIDDFGTGYSSLSYLARLPVDALKIDRSFIVGLTRSANDMAIVSSVISLAHGLRLAVIAEGVEHEDQRRLLQLLRCDQMQGYLYSPAVDSAAIETLLTAQSLQATSAV